MIVYPKGRGFNALEAIKSGVEFLLERGRIPAYIATHPSWTTRGYVFVTERDGKAYIVCHSLDFTQATAQVMMDGHEEDLSDYTLGFPVSIHDQDIQKAIGGIYLWTFELK